MIGGDQHRGDRQNHDRELDLGKLEQPCALKPPNHSFSIKAVLRPTEHSPTHPSCFHLKTHFPRTANKVQGWDVEMPGGETRHEQTGGKAGQGQMNSTGMSHGKSSKKYLRQAAGFPGAMGTLVPQKGQFEVDGKW